jgi:ring-1,2-phenylacetyl-CoA epoxidase subunit PaaB
MDTQWQRYEVFEKERPDWPHRNAGSVHAPDAEMALENARDVFVRRPNCLSLWVIPSRTIFSRTVEELGSDESWRETPSPSDPEPYLVFQKQGQAARETFVVHVGEVEAASPAHALARALETFSHENVFVWWVAPARAVTRSREQDASSMFDPAHEKKYRHHLDYPVEPIMRQLKSAAGMFDREPSS